MNLPIWGLKLVFLHRGGVGLSMEHFLREDRMPLPKGEALQTLDARGALDAVCSRRCAVRRDCRRAGRTPAALRNIICMDAPRAMRFGCGHTLCCRACLPRLVGQPCPNCREPLTSEVTPIGETDAGHAVATFELNPQPAPARGKGGAKGKGHGKGPRHGDRAALRSVSMGRGQNRRTAAGMGHAHALVATHPPLSHRSQYCLGAEPHLNLNDLT